MDDPTNSLPNGEGSAPEESKAAQRLVAVLRDLPSEGLSIEELPSLQARLQAELDALEAERLKKPSMGQALHVALTKIAEQATTHTHQTGVLVAKAMPGVWTNPHRAPPERVVGGRTLESEHYLARSDAKNAALHGILTQDLPYREEDGTTGRTRLLDVVARGGQCPGGFLSALAACEVDTPSGRRTVGDILRAALPSSASVPTVRLDQHVLLYWPSGSGDVLLTPLTSVALFGELQSLLGRRQAYDLMRIESPEKSGLSEAMDYDLPRRALNFSEKRWSNMGSGWPGSVGKGGGNCLRADLTPFGRPLPLERLSLDLRSKDVRRTFEVFHGALTSQRPDNREARESVESALRRLFEEMVEPIAQADPEEGSAVSWLGRAARGEMEPADAAVARSDLLEGIRQIQGEVSLSADTWLWIERVLDVWLERQVRMEWSS